MKNFLKSLTCCKKQGVYPVRWERTSYVLVGCPVHGGAISTRHAFNNFLTSTAHLFSDERILSFGRIVGDKSQLKIGKKEKA